MRLSNVNDEDLRKVSLLKNQKGNATSEARIAQQILLSRNYLRIGCGSDAYPYKTTLDANPLRDYKSFAEENDGLTIEEYLERRREQQRERSRKKKNGGY